MKKKLNLEKLSIKSFETSIKSDDLKGGASLACFSNTDCYSQCFTYCPKICKPNAL